MSAEFEQDGAADDLPADGAAASVPQGLSWSWELNVDELLAALGTPAGTQADDPDDQEAVLDAAADGRVIPAELLTGRIAEHLPAGPGLAGWLALAPPADLEDHALAGVMASWRRLASWAQAGELAVAAQIASRAASRDDKIAVADDGRPVQVPADAAAEVSLALAMTHYGACWWTDLGVTLAWRLAATGAALRSGRIDLQRARLIAETTVLLDDGAARAVEALVLPNAGFQTTGQLRAALRRAVIAADPEGAERRREEAERRAKVSLYADDEGTATLAGQSLPGTRAAAAMARINALARALKASGAGDGIDLLRAQVFTGLLLGTLPFIPPAEDGPSDCPPPDSRPPDSPPDKAPGGPDPGDEGGDPGPAGWTGVSPGPADGTGDFPEPGVPADDFPEFDATGDDCDEADHPQGGQPGEGPVPADEDDDWADRVPSAAWPGLPAFLRPGPAGLGDLRPAKGGMLDLCVSWPTLAGLSPEPGQLSRLGPITPAEARRLADLAAADSSAEWRVILTSPQGEALGVARIPRRQGGPAGCGGLSGRGGGPGRDSPVQQRDGPAGAVGLVSRVTVIVPGDLLGSASSAVTERLAARPSGLILTAALRAASRAAERSAAIAAADAATGGCSHTVASAAYKPPTALREFVVARDQTCRLPTCRQPAWRGDLDHTVPYDSGGRTCRCNLGGLCRADHLLKHRPGWSLVQTAPGTFLWTTPSGRTYRTGPEVYAA